MKCLMAGDSALIVELEQEISPRVNAQIKKLTEHLDGLKHPAIIDILPTYHSILINYDPLKMTFEDFIKILETFSFAGNAGCESLERLRNTTKEVVEIPVLYGGKYGPDLENIAEHHHFSVEDVIKIHSASEYLVYMLGFTPGFPYLGGMSKDIATPRLKEPRAKIPAGSVGIAGEQTGIYPLESPGGWQLLGQTPLELFSFERSEPFLLKAGDYLKFIPIDEEEFVRIKKAVAATKEVAAKKEIRAGSMQEEGYLQGKKVCFKVLEAGILSTVQDLGRYGYQRFGVTPSGVMDEYSARIANILVGNGEGDALLETTLQGVSLELLCDINFAVTGAEIALNLNGQNISLWVRHAGKCGDILTMGYCRNGVRNYLAFQGGIDVPVVLGSRSTNLRAGFGGYQGRKLNNGDVVATLVANTNSPKALVRELRSKMPIKGEELEIRVLLGQQQEAFCEQGLKDFFTNIYEVSLESDRMGLRLSGKAIEHRLSPDIISGGMTFGAIQIPGNGQPIIMMADRQTTGGYTKIGNVITVDLPKLAQAAPFTKIRFTQVDYQSAVRELDVFKAMFENRAGEMPKGNGIKRYKITIEGTSYQVEVEDVGGCL